MISTGDNEFSMFEQQMYRDRIQQVQQAMEQAGLYSYVTVDDQNRWAVVADTELGHIDVRLGATDLIVEVWDTSPGLFWDEEDERRWYAKEYAASISLPAIARGFLEEWQEAWWDETDHGVGARIHYVLPIDHIDDVATFAMSKLDELNDLLGLLETRLLD